MTEHLPRDLIDARHAARLARTHISTIHRWVQTGKLRGWKRRGARKKEPARLFVSRADVEGMFLPVAVVPQDPASLPATTGEQQALDQWADDVLHAAGVIP